MPNAEKITADTQEGYTLTQQNLILCAQFLSTVDLDGMLERMAQASLLAPMFNPTLHLRGGAQMELLADVARAGRKFQRAWTQFVAEYPELEDTRRRTDPLRGCDPNEFDQPR